MHNLKSTMVFLGCVVAFGCIEYRCRPAICRGAFHWLREFGSVHGNLFKGPEKVLDNAYTKRAEQVAYAGTARPKMPGRLR